MAGKSDPKSVKPKKKSTPTTTKGKDLKVRQLTEEELDKVSGGILKSATGPRRDDTDGGPPPEDKSRQSVCGCR
jgi:bacteriocin-like protein